MGKGGGGSTQTTVQSNAPWGPTGQALQFGYQKSQDLYDFPQYPGDFYTEFNPIQEQALNLTQQRALAGSPVTSLAQSEAAQTLGGGYLDPRSNPYLQSAVSGALGDVGRAYAESVMPQLQSQFVGAGRYGSGLQQASESLVRQDMLTKMGDIASGMYGKAYESERDRMLKQGALAPQYQGMDYTDLSNLAAVGDIRDQKAREILQSDILKYQYPKQQLDDYIRSISGLSGGAYGTLTTQSPQPGSSLLGGALGGYGLGRSIATTINRENPNPLISVGGAILGGLFK